MSCRAICPSCGNCMAHVGKTDALYGGHHPTGFQCRNPHCDEQPGVIRG